MKFGLTPIEEAEGAVLAHGVRIGGARSRRATPSPASGGWRWRRRAWRASSRRAWSTETSARTRRRLRSPSVSLARICAVRRRSPGGSTCSRETAGLTIIDAEAIDRVNAVDEAITVATLPPYRAVADGDMVATVKIIPFATPARTLEAALAALGAGGAIAVQPFRPMRIGVVSTMLPGLKASVVAKTLRVLEARLAPAGARIAAQETVPHEVGPLAKALGRLIDGSDALVAFGASAITDRRDVIPAAIEAIGGRIERFGMPVDPGNLLLLAERAWDPDHRRAGLRPVAERERLRLGPAAGAGRAPIHDADIRAMGVGGLLMEIGTRPQPRAPGD